MPITSISKKKKTINKKILLIGLAQPIDFLPLDSDIHDQREGHFHNSHGFLCLSPSKDVTKLRCEAILRREIWHRNINIYLLGALLPD